MQGARITTVHFSQQFFDGSQGQELPVSAEQHSHSPRSTNVTGGIAELSIMPKSMKETSHVRTSCMKLQ